MKTFDSTLAYFVNQLDNLDPKLYEPLVDIRYGRDIKLRTGISMGHESTSFIRSAFGGVGTQSAQGKPWLSANTTAIPGVSINGERVVLPLRLCGRELSYSSVELERSQLTGAPIDTQKFDALNLMYQMSVDEMVYIGDADAGATGLVNNAQVTTGAVTGGVWTSKTPDDILKDVNDAIQQAWAASGFAVCPDKLLLPPPQYAYISSAKVSNDASKSILTYLEDNSISLRVNGRKLDIRPCKWLTGRGAGGADRMVAYTNDENRVRFPLVPIRRETPYYHGIIFSAPYIWGLGEVEFVYPETALYMDGI